MLNEPLLGSRLQRKSKEALPPYSSVKVSEVMLV